MKVQSCKQRVDLVGDVNVDLDGDGNVELAGLASGPSRTNVFTPSRFTTTRSEI